MELHKYRVTMLLNSIHYRNCGCQIKEIHLKTDYQDCLSVEQKKNIIVTFL